MLNFVYKSGTGYTVRRFFFISSAVAKSKFWTWIQKTFKDNAFSILTLLLELMHRLSPIIGKNQIAEFSSKKVFIDRRGRCSNSSNVYVHFSDDVVT